MARGQQKIQSQQKNAKKAAEKKKGQGADQKTAAKAALVHTCPVCRTQMPDPKTFKQHFESKHPKSPMPPELADVQAWRTADWTGPEPEPGIHNDHGLNVESWRLKDVDDEHWGTRQYSWTAGCDGGRGWTRVCAVYVCVCMKKTITTGQKYTSTPFYIYYVQLPYYSKWGGDRRDCLLTLNKTILWLMTGSCETLKRLQWEAEKKKNQHLNVWRANSWLYQVKHFRGNDGTFKAPTIDHSSTEGTALLLGLNFVTPIILFPFHLNRGKN